MEQVQLHKQFLDLAAYLFVLRLEKPALEQQFLIGALLAGVILVVVRALIEGPPAAPARRQQLCQGLWVPFGAAVRNLKEIK